MDDYHNEASMQKLANIHWEHISAMFNDATTHPWSLFSLKITPPCGIHLRSQTCGKWQVNIFMHVSRQKNSLKSGNIIKWMKKSWRAADLQMWAHPLNFILAIPRWNSWLHWGQNMHKPALLKEWMHKTEMKHRKWGQKDMDWSGQEPQQIWQWKGENWCCKGGIAILGIINQIRKYTKTLDCPTSLHQISIMHHHWPNTCGTQCHTTILLEFEPKISQPACCFVSKPHCGRVPGVAG